MKSTKPSIHLVPVRTEPIHDPDFDAFRYFSQRYKFANNLDLTTQQSWIEYISSPSFLTEILDDIGKVILLLLERIEDSDDFSELAALDFTLDVAFEL
jgi:hypothetical protein